MAIVFGAIVPHAFSIIPEMAHDLNEMATTRAAMDEVERRFMAAAPDVVVVVGPHGFRVDSTVCVADTGRGAGTLVWDGRQVELNVPIDGALTDAVAIRAIELGVPVARGGYAGTRRDQAVIPIDWGVITPLWYLGHGRNMVGSGHVLAPKPTGPDGPATVIATPSRKVPREKLIDFGRAVAEAAAEDGRRVAFVASCDWGHRHRADGPYGYHEASARVDKIMVDAVKADRLRDMLVVSDEEAAEAAIDGLWQAIMLAGAIEHTPLKGEFLSYEAPTYFGMIVAAYEPDAGESLGSVTPN
jgi:aromatic ring-opening dioxygenase LigB subunit